MNCSSANGRIDILGNNIAMPFLMNDKIPIKESSNFHDALSGNWKDTPLSQAYFSKENIIIIQNALRRGVYEESNGAFLIGEQDTDELKIIMRSIFLMYSKNNPENIPDQISELNDLVLKYAINQVYGEAQAYTKYKHDISTMYVPFPRIGSYSNTKDKTLELKNWF